MCIQYIKLEHSYINYQEPSFPTVWPLEIELTQTNTHTTKRTHEMVFTKETVSLIAAVTICHGKRHTQ